MNRAWAPQASEFRGNRGIARVGTYFAEACTRMGELFSLMRRARR
jgi:hypothetical protein